MARPAAPAFTLGKVNFKRLPSDATKVQARGTYRDGANRLRNVTASGKTEPAALRALKAKVEQARTEYVGGDDSLNSKTTVAAAAKVWLDQVRRQRSNGKPLAPRTIQQYEGNVRRYITGSDLDALTLTMVNDVSRIEGWLSKIADQHGEGAAKAARKVVGGILGLAQRRGAVQVSVMPMVKTPGASEGSHGARDRDHDTGRAFTPEDVARIFAAAEESRADVADLIAFLFATGCRISEALRGVEWDGIDWQAGTVRIDGTKTTSSKRTVTLPPWMLDRLRQRAETFGATGLVFGITRYPSKLGQPRDVSNVLHRVTAVLDKAGCEWAGSHTFRRTVATWMDDQGYNLGEIAGQLGHGNIVTTTGYVKRKTVPTGAAAAMVLPTAKPNLTVLEAV